MSELSDHDRTLAVNRMSLFLQTAIQACVKSAPGEFPYAFSRLIEQIAANGCNSIAPRLLETPQGEYRLNGAGFKLFWVWEDSKNGLRLRIGGDQTRMYPQTVSVLKKLIADNHWGYID